MKIRPLADRVVIKKFEAEEKTASGIVLPTAAKEQPQMAEVIEVGPGGIVDGNEVKMEVKVGDYHSKEEALALIETCKKRFEENKGE